MKTAGIIAEYNPFHKGHQFQLDYTKEKLGADYVIVAMSGDYVQRGTPALLPKHMRAEMALRCGADLVLELPASVSCASAEFFAGGGVSLLGSLGVVDMLCFGSEEGEMPLFHLIAKLLVEEPFEYRSALQGNLKKGLSFPSARGAALLSCFSSPGNALTHENEQQISSKKLTEFLASPNNILGIEYCKAILRQKSSLTPVTLKREGAGYHDTDLRHDAAPSASGIRTFLKEYFSSSFAGISGTSGNTAAGPEELEKLLQGMIPSSALPLFAYAVRSHAFLSENDLDLLLHYCLLSETSDSLCQYLDISPELAARILKLRNQYQGFTQFTELLKTRELTYTRIQRALLHMLLHITDAPPAIPYARVLGFRKSAVPLLRAIKKEGQIPLLTKLADASNILDTSAQALLDQTVYASNVYESLLCQKTHRPFVHEYQKPVIVL